MKPFTRSTAMNPTAATGRSLAQRVAAGALATVMLLTAGGTLAFYAYSIYMQKFLANSAGFSRETASAISTAICPARLRGHSLTVTGASPRPPAYSRRPTPS